MISNFISKFKNTSYLVAMTIYFGYYFIFVTVSFFNASYVINSLTTYNENFSSLSLDTIKSNAATSVGYAFTISLLVAIVLMLIISRLIDKKVISAKTAILFSFVIAIITFIVLALSEGNILLYAFIINGGVLYALPSFLDTLVLEDIDEHDYSFIRSFGSFGAAISYFFSSYTVLSDNFYITAITDIIILIIISIFVLRLKAVIKTEKMKYKDGMNTLLSSRNILLMFIIAFLTYGVIRADDSFANLYAVETVGLSTSYIAIVGLLSIAFEGIVMNIYIFLRNLIGLKTILFIAIGTLIFIFYTKYAYYDNALLVSIGNILFGIYVGFFVPIMIHVIAKFGPLSVQSTLLSIYQVCVLVGGVILAFITTLTYNVTNFLPDIYLLHTIIVIVSLIFVFLLKDID